MKDFRVLIYDGDGFVDGKLFMLRNKKGGLGDLPERIGQMRELLAKSQFQGLKVIVHLDSKGVLKEYDASVVFLHNDLTLSRRAFDALCQILAGRKPERQQLGGLRRKGLISKYNQLTSAGRMALKSRLIKP
jgi:hypothetical protein